MEVSEELDRAENVVAASDEPIPEEPVRIDPNDLDVIRSMPEATVMIQWREIEALMKTVVEKYGLSSTNARATLSARRLRLAKTNAVSDETMSVLKQLSEIRNKVVHGADISSSEAMRFYDLAQMVKYDLERAAERAAP